MHKHRYVPLCLCLSLLCGLLAPAYPLEAATTAPFPDMAKSWFGYQDNVTYLKAKGAIGGYPDGLFHPKQTVNRAEFLKLVFSSKTDSEPVTDDCFADVPASAWFAPFVCAAKRRGIVSGYKVGSRQFFKPDQPIVFAEAVKMAVLAYGNTVSEPQGEQWYKPYVQKIDDEKILGSWSYNPADPITRERAADLIAKYVKHDNERALANLSPGCGKDERSPSLTLSVGGMDRSYILTKARGASSNTPSPLIVAFHGKTNSNEQVQDYYGLDRAASKYFIAYPAGIPTGNGSFSWSDGNDKPQELRDIAFFDAIVREIGDSECIDMNRIYVVGHSLGAWFANSVACARGGVVRASATVGGSAITSNCTGPTAAMIINNPKDALSPQSSAVTMRDVRIKENTCSAQSSSVEPTSLSCVQYASCTQNPVVFCPHTIDYERSVYYPHVWPPGTADAMVKFFEGL